MNKNDLLEVQEVAIEKVFELENIKRKEYFAQYRYIVTFKEYILEQARLKYENTFMLDAIKAKSENLEFDMDLKKKELENKINEFNHNVEIAKQVLDIYSKYTSEQIELLDSTYYDFVKYHPAINVKASKEQVHIYQMLTSVYLVGEVNDFIAMYEEAKGALTELVVEDDIEEIIKVYNLTIENLTVLIEKRINSLPLKYLEIVDDEAKITSEISRFREAVYELRNINKNLKLDYKLNFNVEF